MKIRLGTLRQLVREAAMSPAFFAQSKVHDDPMADPQIVQSIKQFENAYKTSLVKNLVLHAADKYDQKTRQFNDAAYDEIENSASVIANQVVDRLKKLAAHGWSVAHKDVKQGKPNEKQIAA